MESHVLKRQDAAVEIVLIDYPTLKLAEAISKRWTVSPLVFTGLAFLARIIAVLAFVQGLLPWGAVGVFAGMLFDGTDGKLARIQGRDANRVGAFDFISDQLATLILAGGLTVHLFPFGIVDTMAVYSWVAVYVMCLAVGSTYFRLSPNSLRDSGSKSVESSSGHFGSDGVLSRLARYYFSWVRRLARFRLTPYSTVVDSEFVIFVLYPLFQQISIIWFASVLMAPNLVYLFGSVLFVLSNSTEDHLD